MRTLISRKMSVFKHVSSTVGPILVYAYENPQRRTTWPKIIIDKNREEGPFYACVWLHFFFGMGGGISRVFLNKCYK